MLPTCTDTYIPSAFVDSFGPGSQGGGGSIFSSALGTYKIAIPTDYPLNQELGPFSL